MMFCDCVSNSPTVKDSREMKVYVIFYSFSLTLHIPAGTGIRMKIGSLHGMAGREGEENKLLLRDYWNILHPIRIREGLKNVYLKVETP